MSKARAKTYKLTEQSQSQYSDSQSEYIQKRKQPKFFKHSLEKLDLDKIVLNVSHCHYPIVTTIGKKLGWKVQQSSYNQNWDLYWTDSAIQSEQLFRMLQYQKINHFPGMYVIARKDCLARALMRMRKHQAAEYDFFPLTWHIPSELNEFTVQYETAKSQGRNPTYIVKPQASCQGKGIFLTRKLQTVINQQESCVVQKYIEKPYLINGLKFDFRVYVLLAGCDPLRIYVYKEGLARFATQQYTQPEKSNLKHSYIHLTNYAINKDNPAFVFNTSTADMNTGHKRSLTSVFRLLDSQGIDSDEIRLKINQIIVKTIITGQPLLSHLYNLSQPDNYSNDMCFQILGFDILLEHTGEPKLLEVNHTPSFVTDTPLDEHIKGNLIKDTLVLINMNTERKNRKVAISKEKEQLRFNCKKAKVSVREKIQIKETQQRLRHQYQSSNLGGFMQAYPVEDAALMKRYSDMLELSRGIFNKSNINKKVSNAMPQVPILSPRRTRVKTIPPKQSPTAKQHTPKIKDSPKPKQFSVKQSIEFQMPLLPSLKLQQIKSTVQTVKTTGARDYSQDFRKSKSRLFEKPNDTRLQSQIYQKIRHMEINNIEKDMRTTRRIEKLKNMSLGARHSIEKSKTKDMTGQKDSPMKGELSKNYTTTALKGSFLIPKILRMSDMQKQMYEKQGKKHTNYQKFLLDHDLKSFRNSVNNNQ